MGLVEALANRVLDGAPLPADIDVAGTVDAFRSDHLLSIDLQQRLVGPLGRRLEPEPETPGRQIPSAGLWEDGPPVGVAFGNGPPRINGLQLVSSAAGLPQRLGTMQELVLTFPQTRPGPLTLVLKHHALRSFGWGFVELKVMADRQTLIERWAPPADGTTEERLPLGDMPTGYHTLVIQVQPRSRTVYAVDSLWIEGTQ